MKLIKKVLPRLESAGTELTENIRIVGLSAPKPTLSVECAVLSDSASQNTLLFILEEEYSDMTVAFLQKDDETYSMLKRQGPFSLQCHDMWH